MEVGSVAVAGNRILVLGRGGSVKSTLSRGLSLMLGIPHIELDTHFWSDEFEPLSKYAWELRQREILSGDEWIADGDLWEFDSLSARLELATAVILCDFPLWKSTYRVLRRGREDIRFWKWMVTYRSRFLPNIMRDIVDTPNLVRVHVLRNDDDVDALMSLYGKLDDEENHG